MDAANMPSSNSHGNGNQDDFHNNAVPQHSELNSTDGQQQLLEVEAKAEHQHYASAGIQGVSSVEASDFHASRSNVYGSAAEASNFHTSRSSLSGMTAEPSHFHGSRTNLHGSTAEASNFHASRTNLSASSSTGGVGLRSPLAKSTTQLEPAFHNSLKLNPDRFSGLSPRTCESGRPSRDTLSKNQATMLQWFPSLKSVLKASSFCSEDSLELADNVRVFL
jgi:hypothetical protein